VYKVVSVVVCPGTELLDLFQNKSSAFRLVLDLLVLVNNNKDVSLFVGCVP
jgi:hypothetical protein